MYAKPVLSPDYSIPRSEDVGEAGKMFSKEKAALGCRGRFQSSTKWPVLALVQTLRIPGN